jgi:1-acyl-sn-glycerol-3-phosphate acyltransferase
MAFHNVEKFSLGYFVLKAYANIANHIFYRKIQSFNKHNVPKEGAVILAPNHQNALMDALALVFNLKGYSVFLARADIFKKKSIARILYFLKILPIYRMRDGASELQKNQEVFSKTVQILQKNMRLTILPEGNHAGFRKLRPLQKGISRISFQAEETADFKLGIRIVPVGLDYSHYYKFRHNLFINYGKPIEVADFYDTYHENPQKAMNELKQRVASELSKLMLDIQSEEFYDTYYSLRDIYRDRIGAMLQINAHKQPGKFMCEKAMIGMLDRYIEQNADDFKPIDEKVRKYKKDLKRLQLRDWVVRKKSYSIIRLVLESLMKLVLLPVYLYGIITNILPFQIPVWATKEVKDKQFLSSIRFVVAMLVFPIMYAVFYIVFSRFVDSAWWRISFLLSLPLSGYIAFIYSNWVKRTWARFRYSLTNKKHMQSVYQLRNSIREDLDKIAEKIKPVKPDLS